MGPLTTEGSGPPVAARSLSFRYPAGRSALREVDLDVRAGQRLAIVGPNGSGKTTLLRVIAGRLPSFGGRLRVLGAEPPFSSGILRRVGFAGADAVHRDALTGRENAHFFARAAGLSGREVETGVSPLLSRLGLDGVADTPVAEYSRGMRRKLLLVEALAHDPDLILLDEPFGGLDPPGAEALEALLTDRAESGAAVLLATHAVDRVPELADRAVFLHGGRVVADAPPGALLERHRGRSEATVRATLPDGGGQPSLPAPFRLDGADKTPEGGAGKGREGTFRISWPRTEAGVPELVARCAEAGIEVRELRVREPDLSRAFRELTGTELDE